MLELGDGTQGWDLRLETNGLEFGTHFVASVWECCWGVAPKEKHGMKLGPVPTSLDPNKGRTEPECRAWGSSGD